MQSLDVYRGDDLTLSVAVRDFDVTTDVSAETWTVTFRTAARVLLGSFDVDPASDLVSGLLRVTVDGDDLARWPVGPVFVDFQYIRQDVRRTAGQMILNILEDFAV